MRVYCVGHEVLEANAVFQPQPCQCESCSQWSAYVLIGVECKHCGEQGAIALCKAEHCYPIVMSRGLTHEHCPDGELGIIMFSEPLELPERPHPPWPMRADGPSMATYEEIKRFAEFTRMSEQLTVEARRAFDLPAE